MMKIERKTLIGSLLLTALLSVGTVHADEDKGIRVRESGSGAETSNATVTIESVKSEYKVDEPIRFRVKATKPMYVYVYAVDADTGNALMLVLLLSLPPIIVATAVGMLVSLLQALTQIQEQTLSFVPKLAAVFLSLIVFGSFMLSTLVSFTQWILLMIAEVK